MSGAESFVQDQNVVHTHSLGGQVTECQTAVVRTVHSTVQYLSHRGGRILDSDAI